MLNIPKEVIVYAYKQENQIFLVILSVSQGWGLVKVNLKHIFLKKKFCFSILKNKRIVNSYKNLIINFILGFYRYFFQFVKLKGMAYKAMVVSSTLVFKLGYSHRILYTSYKNIKVLYLSKQLLMVIGRSINKIKNIIYTLRSLRKVNVYKKKGIFFKGSIVKLKQSSKKSKF